jgi:hypothetical protein
MSDAFVCGCKGTVHDPHCYVWKQALNVQQQPVTYASIADDAFERDLFHKLDRIIVLLEEIAGRRR